MTFATIFTAAVQSLSPHSKCLLREIEQALPQVQRQVQSQESDQTLLHETLDRFKDDERKIIAVMFVSRAAKLQLTDKECFHKNDGLNKVRLAWASLRLAYIATDDLGELDVHSVRRFKQTLGYTLGTLSFNLAAAFNFCLEIDNDEFYIYNKYCSSV